MAGNNNLSAFYRGDTKAMNLEFKDAGGRPLDISNHVLWFTMKRDVSDLDEDAVFQKNITFPPNEDSAKGVGVLTLSSVETKGIEPGTYHYDIQHVIPENPPIVSTFSGRVAVLADITRSDGT